MRKSNSLLMMAAGAAIMSANSLSQDLNSVYAGTPNHKYKYPNQRQKRKMWAQNPSLRRK